MFKKTLLTFLIIAIWSVYLANFTYAEELWIHPFLEIRGTYDDNIYLSESNEKDDWITTVSPGVVIEPPLNKHRFTCDYRADLNYFTDYDEEDNYNHITNADLELNFNKFRLNLTNMFYYFSSRSGREDVGRIARTRDYASAGATFMFAKMDLALIYNYRLENYRSTDPIGSFRGQTLTYEDLDRDEYEGEVEAALKLWPKTSLLFSSVYGVVEHDTGKKSDSSYYDALVGLRGEPTAKCTVEAKIGYRGQDYDDYDDDFDSLVFKGTLIEDFTSRDTLRLDFVRTTDDTTYKNNAYYEMTYIDSGFKHGFTERIFGNIDFSYQRNDYPTTTTEAGKTAEREDDFYSGGVGLSYEMPKWFVFDVKYKYMRRDSNFSSFEYDNNTVSVGLTGSF